MARGTTVLPDGATTKPKGVRWATCERQAADRKAADKEQAVHAWMLVNRRGSV